MTDANIVKGEDDTEVVTGRTLDPTRLYHVVLNGSHGEGFITTDEMDARQAHRGRSLPVTSALGDCFHELYVEEDHDHETYGAPVRYAVTLSLYQQDLPTPLEALARAREIAEQGDDVGAYLRSWHEGDLEALAEWDMI